MGEPTPIEVIDKVLHFFATKEIAKTYIPYDLILHSFKLYTNDLIMILNKLKKDEYVCREEITNKLTKEVVNGYRITFEGLLFYNQGGYEQEMIRRNAESIRVEKLEISQQTLMAKLNVLTGWVAGGTIALVLVEILKMLNDHFHWWN